MCYTQRDLFYILLNQTQIRLYLPCTDCFETANGRCPFDVPNQSVYGKYNLICIYHLVNTMWYTMWYTICFAMWWQGGKWTERSAARTPPNLPRQKLDRFWLAVNLTTGQPLWLHYQKCCSVFSKCFTVFLFFSKCFTVFLFFSKCFTVFLFFS